MSRPKSFLYFHDVPLNQASDICGVSVQTVKRWISTGRAPSAAVHLVELYRDRRVIPESWAGKVVIRDSFGLCTQSGYSISFSQLETYGWHLASFWRRKGFIRLP